MPKRMPRPACSPIAAGISLLTSASKPAGPRATHLKPQRLEVCGLHETWAAGKSVLRNQSAVGDQRRSQPITILGVENAIRDLHVVIELRSRLLPLIDLRLYRFAFTEPDERRSAAAGA